VFFVETKYEISLCLVDILIEKLFFLFQIKTDRLMTLLPLPPHCVALEELPNSECQSVLKELLSSLQHPYIYPILDLGFFHTESHHYACLVMPFNPRGSLKDLIYKVGTFDYS
jgi:serine/threonine protein kinase